MSPDHLRARQKFRQVPVVERALMPGCRRHPDPQNVTPICSWYEEVLQIVVDVNL
jgi:hypothetical protein